MHAGKLELARSLEALGRVHACAHHGARSPHRYVGALRETLEPLPESVRGGAQHGAGRGRRAETALDLRRPCAPTCLAPNTAPTRLCPTASAAVLLLLLLAVVLVLLVVLLLATCWR